MNWRYRIRFSHNAPSKWASSAQVATCWCVMSLPITVRFSWSQIFSSAVRLSASAIRTSEPCTARLVRLTATELERSFLERDFLMLPDRLELFEWCCCCCCCRCLLTWVLCCTAAQRIISSIETMRTSKTARSAQRVYKQFFDGFDEKSRKNTVCLFQRGDFIHVYNCHEHYLSFTRTSTVMSNPYSLLLHNCCTVFIQYLYVVNTAI